MATRINNLTIVETFTEHGVEELLIPGVVIEVDDEDEADQIKHANNAGIKKMQRKIYLSEWVEVD